MKKIASFLALCIICTGLSVVNASNGMQGVSSSIPETETTSVSQTAYLLIYGFTAGHEQVTTNIVLGILMEYEHYEDLSVSSYWESNSGLVLIVIRGPMDYLSEALNFLSVNKPQYLTIEVRMTL